MSKDKSWIFKRCLVSHPDGHDVLLIQVWGAAGVLRRQNIFARVAQRARHPDKLVQKFLHTRRVSRIGNLTSRRIEKLPSGTEINVPENCYQTKLPQHRD